SDARRTRTSEDDTVRLQSVGLPSLKAERPLTRSVIAAIPSDKATYAPDPVTRSAIDLAWHIVTAENRFIEAVVDGAFDLTTRDRPASMRTPADINRWYEEQFNRNIERLALVQGDQLVRPIDFRGVFKFPAVIYVQLALN